MKKESLQNEWDGQDCGVQRAYCGKGMPQMWLASEMAMGLRILKGGREKGFG